MVVCVCDIERTGLWPFLVWLLLRLLRVHPRPLPMVLRESARRMASAFALFAHIFALTP